MKKITITAVMILMSLFLIGCSGKTEAAVDSPTASIPSDTETETTIEATAPSIDDMVTATVESQRLSLTTNSVLSYEDAETMLKNLIEDLYEADPREFSSGTYNVYTSAKIENSSIQAMLDDYLRDSESPDYYNSMGEYGTYYSVQNLAENEIVLFEMDNNHFAIAEAGDSIADYSMRYPFLFTFRNSDSTTAYYWCAQENLDYVLYASCRVVRIWVYNTDRNSYSCIFEQQ